MVESWPSAFPNASAQKTNDIVSSSVTNKKANQKEHKNKKSYYQMEKRFYQTQMYLQQTHDKQTDL
jgi:hypothetical protein